MCIRDSEYAEEGDNLIVIPEEEGEINVAWFMYEFVALAIPMKHVHAPVSYTHLDVYKRQYSFYGTEWVERVLS